MSNEDKIFDIIDKSKRIAIFSHVSHDGDCVGSAMGIAQSLRLMGKEVAVYIDDIISENFYFLFNNNILNTVINDEYDLCISVDSSDVSRLGKYSKYFLSHSDTIAFDHHFNHRRYSKFLVLDTEASSACEVVYNFIKQFDMPIDIKVAQALYSGIASDTGRFLYTTTSPDVHYIAGDLIKYGFDLEEVHYYLFMRKTHPQLALLANALSSIETYFDGKVSIICLTKKIFEQTNTSEKDVLGLVSYGLYLDGVVLCVLISECEDNSCRISFRSTSKFDSNSIAQVFGGGGHKRASGCKIHGKSSSVKSKIIDEVAKLL